MIGPSKEIGSGLGFIRVALCVYIKHIPSYFSSPENGAFGRLRVVPAALVHGVLVERRVLQRTQHGDSDHVFV